MAGVNRASLTVPGASSAHVRCTATQTCSVVPRPVVVTPSKPFDVAPAAIASGSGTSRTTAPRASTSTSKFSIRFGIGLPSPSAAIQ